MPQGGLDERERSSPDDEGKKSLRLPSASSFVLSGFSHPSQIPPFLIGVGKVYVIPSFSSSGSDFFFLSFPLFLLVSRQPLLPVYRNPGKLRKHVGR